MESVKANSQYHAVSMPIPYRSPAALIHTRHAATVPPSDNAVSFVKFHLVDGNIRTASEMGMLLVTTFVKFHVVDGNIRTASEMGMLLVTTFVELRVVAGRSRTRAGRPNTVFGRPMLIHTYHAVPMPLLCRAVPWP
jgi:hypothetical protein